MPGLLAESGLRDKSVPKAYREARELQAALDRQDPAVPPETLAQLERVGVRARLVLKVLRELQERLDRQDPLDPTGSLEAQVQQALWDLKVVRALLERWVRQGLKAYKVRQALLASSDPLGKSVPLEV